MCEQDGVLQQVVVLEQTVVIFNARWPMCQRGTVAEIEIL